MSHKDSFCLDCFLCSARDLSIFSSLNEKESYFLQSKKNNLILNYGEVLFREGQYPSGFYIITEGKLKISKFGLEGREQIVRFAKEGDVVGYRSLISEESYSCTATAISQVKLCFLKGDAITALLKSNYELSIQFMKLLANDLKKSEAKLLNLSQKSVRERIAESILLLHQMYGTEEDGATLNVILKRDELAGISGTIRETATRFLYELNESKIIELVGKKIKIIDFKKLQKTANV